MSLKNETSLKGENSHNRQGGGDSLSLVFIQYLLKFPRIGGNSLSVNTTPDKVVDRMNMSLLNIMFLQVHSSLHKSSFVFFTRL